MKLTQFAFAAIIVLLLVAGYLTVKSDLDGRLSEQKDFNREMLARMEELSKRPASPAPVAATPAPVVSAPVAPVPTPAGPVTRPPVSPAAAEALAAAAAIPATAPLAPENDPRMLADEAQALADASAGELLPGEAPGATPSLQSETLTTVQRRIAAAPAIAQVKQYAAKEGMLVLDRGASVGMKPGDLFSLRRKTAAIGRVRISDTIEQNECVADIVPNSMPPGMLPEAGDEIIQFEP